MPNTYQLTIGGVRCNELHDGSGRDNLDLTPGSKSVTAQRVFICDWGNRYALISGVLYTQHPAILHIFAAVFQIEPVGKPTGENQWNQAKVVVGYKNFNFDPTDYKEVSVETSAENVSLNSDGFEFQSGGTDIAKKVDIDPSVYIPFTQITVTKHNQTTINEPLWAGYLNKVNSDSYNPVGRGGQTWAAGTLLYLGYSFTQKYTTAGISFEVSHKFLGSPIDHRKEFNPQTGDYELVQTKQGNNYKYDTASFSGLGL